MVFTFVCLTCFTRYNILLVHPCCCKWGFSILIYSWVIFHCVYSPYLYRFFWSKYTYSVPVPGLGTGGAGMNNTQSLFSTRASQVMLVVKKPPPSARDITNIGSIPQLGRSAGEGHGNPLQCSCLENPTNRGAWQATVHGSQRVGHN